VSLPDPPILLITDVVAAACAGGCRWIMLREKDLDPEALHALLDDIVAATAPYGATVIVNGDLVLAAHCAGVHLPQGGVGADTARACLGPGALIGVSAHSRAEAEAAASAGADYVTLSPVFVSPSKPDYGPALGPDAFGKVARELAIPVLGLGGIEPENAASVITAGAAGIAVMGSVMRAEDPAAVFAEFVSAIEAVAKPGRV
jgi:thiamine-phosphate pyrophosphorylase